MVGGAVARASARAVLKGKIKPAARHERVRGERVHRDRVMPREREREREREWETETETEGVQAHHALLHASRRRFQDQGLGSRV